jgi:hypothetical protein
VRKTININEAIYTCGKWQQFHRLCSHLIICCTLQDDFLLNLSYKNTHSSCFQLMPDTL